MSKSLVNNKKKLTEDETVEHAATQKKQKLTDTKGKKVQEESSESEAENIIYPTNKGKAAQKGAAKQDAKKKAGSDDDSDTSFDEADFKTKPGAGKQQAGKKTAPAATKKPAKDESSDSEEEPQPKSKQAAQKTAPKATSKPLPKAESDESSEEEVKPTQKKGAVATSGKTTTKPATKKPADSDDSDESEPPKPTKTGATSSKTQTKAAPKKQDSDSDDSESDKPKKTAPKAQTKAPVKKVQDSDESEEEVQVKSKPAAKNNKIVTEEEESEEEKPVKNGGKPKGGQVASLDGGEKGVNEIYVGNLPFTATEQDIADYFAQAGTVVGINLLKGYDGRSKGIAFVRFASEDECAAGTELNGSDYDGRALRIEKSTPKEGRAPAAGKQGGGAPNERDPNSTTVFVGNLSYQATREAVQEFFEACGEVRDVRLATDQEGNLRGFGHVEFASTASVDKAIAMAGQNLDGRPVRVDFSGARKPREGGFGGDGGNRRFGGGDRGFGGGRGGFGGGRGGRGGFGGGRGGFGGNDEFRSANKGSISSFQGNKVRL